MPQKKNPDSLELLRGKSGRIFGNVRLSYSFEAKKIGKCSYDLGLNCTDVRLPDDVEGSAFDVQ